MQKYLFFFLLLFSSCVSLFSQTDLDNQIKKGTDLAYNFQWEKSNEVFQKLIEKYPDDPSGYFYKSRNCAWAYLSGRAQTEYDEFFKLSDIALKKAEQRLDKDSKDETALFILGTSYNYRAVVFGRAESYVNAIWAFKKANSFLKELIEKNRQFYDAYYGLGIYNLVLSEIPSGFKWALNVAGISGDKSTGLSYLKTASQSGKYFKSEAQYYLSQVYSDNFFNYGAAAGQLKKLIVQYPQNSLFLYSYAAVQMKQRKLNEAAQLLNKVIRNETDKKFRQITAYSYFTLGDIYYRKNEFANAIDNYSKFFNYNSLNEYTGIVSLRLGISYEMTNNRNSAVRCFEKAQKGNKNFEEDVYAKRIGETFQKRTIAETEKKVIRGANLIEAGQYNEAETELKEALQAIKTERLKAEACVYLSDVSYELGRVSESIDYAQKARNMNPGDEKWTRPFASYYEARALFKKGDSSGCKTALNAAQSQNKYDFEKKLDIFINNFKRKINH
jgi:tetratricopeptide (TPR) repeat protein